MMVHSGRIGLGMPQWRRPSWDMAGWNMCPASYDVTGRKYSVDFRDTMKILFDDHLPKWNYRALPESG